MADPIRTIDLANEAGVSRQRIAQWGREGLEAAAKVSYGKWDRERALSWIADRREDSPVPLPGSDLQKQLTSARTKLYELQGDAQRLRNEILAGNLVLADTVENIAREQWAGIVAAGDQWVAEGRTGEIQHDRRKLWHDLRTRLFRAIEDISTSLSSGEDVAAARVRYGGRVGR